jgi:hypothetical protein
MDEDVWRERKLGSTPTKRQYEPYPGIEDYELKELMIEAKSVRSGTINVSAEMIKNAFINTTNTIFLSQFLIQLQVVFHFLPHSEFCQISLYFAVLYIHDG